MENKLGWRELGAGKVLLLANSFPKFGFPTQTAKYFMVSRRHWRNLAENATVQELQRRKWPLCNKNGGLSRLRLGSVSEVFALADWQAMCCLSGKGQLLQGPQIGKLQHEILLAEFREIDGGFCFRSE